MVSLSTCGQCSDDDAESSESVTCVTEEAGEDDGDSAVDWTPSSEVSTVETDDGAEDEREKTPEQSSEVSTCVTEDAGDDDGVRRTVGDMTTEDSTRVTGDATRDIAKIPLTSISSSIPVSRRSLSTVASLKTGVSCSRSMRSSSSIALLLLKFVAAAITGFLFLKGQK